MWNAHTVGTRRQKPQKAAELEEHWSGHEAELCHTVFNSSVMSSGRRARRDHSGTVAKLEIAHDAFEREALVGAKAKANRVVRRWCA